MNTLLEQHTKQGRLDQEEGLGPAQKKLSIIIVNYNVKYFLEQALLSVQKAIPHIDAEVFVVDNNSVDDSVAMVREKFPDVHLIANKNNPGFSIANNQAIRISKGEYILLLNPDTVVEEDTFVRSIEFMDAHPKAGALGVKMIDGSGKFLPESKRGFPSPFVAFCKTFGLSSLFPKSKLFNRYHLGYLDENENHQVDVLAGAYMFMRRSALDKVGLLDEQFFMYGEDIDLSYRIVLGGFENYYLADTRIIHYKGESTKRGSLNYVKAFYQAMIIFARKHFSGRQASLFVLGLQFAIYFRAFLTLISNWFRQLLLPVLDAGVIFGGIVLLKNFWANYFYNDPNYYQPSILYFNAPLYIAIWVSSIYLSGGYDNKTNIRQLVRGLFVGTVFIAAVYGFLDLEYRSSRALILLTMIWSIFSLIGLRMLLHFLSTGNFKVGKEKPKNLVIVGSFAESQRVRQLLHLAEVQKNVIGVVNPEEQTATSYLSTIGQLEEVVHIYKIEEIIFCSKDIATQSIMHWMTQLGPDVSYKIVPEDSMSIIGSSSKNAAGELYTIDIQFQIASPTSRRNKRLLDLFLSFLFLLASPFLIFFLRPFSGFLRNIFAVISDQKSWVGYASTDEVAFNLPKLKPGVLDPRDGIKRTSLDGATTQRLNMLYAKDYEVDKDLEIIWNGFRRIGG